jgi:hypothetical protein
VGFDIISADDAAWDDVVEALPHDVYHLRGYAQVSATHEAQPVSLAVASRGGHVLAVPFMLRPLPAELAVAGVDVTVPYGYPAPVCSSDDTSVQHELFGVLLEGFAGLGAVAAFFRCHPLLGVSPEVLASYGEYVVHGQHAVIDVAATAADPLASFRYDHRHGIKVLRKQGFTAVYDRPQDIEAFPELYRENMRRVRADDFYLFPDAYFEQIHARLAGVTHLVGVLSPEGELAAATMVFACPPLGQYHLSATDGRFARVAPIKLGILAMTELCAGLGVRELNLGSGLGGCDDDLFAFKSGFTRHFEPFATARVVIDSARYEELAEGCDAPAGFFPAYRFGR